MRRFRIFLAWALPLVALWTFANWPRGGGSLKPDLEWAGFPWSFASWDGGVWARSGRNHRTGMHAMLALPITLVGGPIQAGPPESISDDREGLQGMWEVLSGNHSDVRDLKGNTLRICWSEAASLARPSRFGGGLSRNARRTPKRKPGAL
jgi:hypothetical protein